MSKVRIFGTVVAFRLAHSTFNPYLEYQKTTIEDQHGLSQTINELMSMDGKTVEASTLIRLFTGVSIDPSCSIVSFLSIFMIIEIGNDNTTFRKTMLKHF